MHPLSKIDLTTDVCASLTKTKKNILEYFRRKTFPSSLHACYILENEAFEMVVPDGFRLQESKPAALDNYLVNVECS